MKSCFRLYRANSSHWIVHLLRVLVRFVFCSFFVSPDLTSGLPHWTSPLSLVFSCQTAPKAKLNDGPFRICHNLKISALPATPPQTTISVTCCGFMTHQSLLDKSLAASTRRTEMQNSRCSFESPTNAAGCVQEHPQSQQVARLQRAWPVPNWHLRCQEMCLGIERTLVDGVKAKLSSESGLRPMQRGESDPLQNARSY